MLSARREVVGASSEPGAAIHRTEISGGCPDFRLDACWASAVGSSTGARARTAGEEGLLVASEDGVPKVGEFLIGLCRWFARGEARPSLASTGVGWGGVFEEAAEHRLDRLLALHFATPPVETAAPFKIAEDLLAAGRERARGNIEAVKELQAALAAAGVPSLARKGNIYGRLFYGDLGLRGQGDNDLFVPKGSGAEASRILQEQGFSIGEFSPRTGVIEGVDRKRMLLFQINPDHLPPATRLIDGAFNARIAIDIAFDITWHSCPDRAVESLLEEEFARPRTVDGVATLSEVGHFLDCMLYIYRNAYMRTAGQQDSGVHLRMFLDLAMIWKRLDQDQRQEAAGRIRRYGLSGIAGWVSTHADEVLGGDILTGLGLADAFDPDSAMTWRDEFGQDRRWSGTMRERLFAGPSQLRAMFGQAAAA